MCWGFGHLDMARTKFAYLKHAVFRQHDFYLEVQWQMITLQTLLNRKLWVQLSLNKSRRHIGGADVQLHLFSTSALDRDEL